jgi:addiction module HigA family antidote
MSTLNNRTDEGTLIPSPYPGITMAKSYPARPRKVAPCHPGEIIGGILDDQRISPRRAAKAIGMSATGLQKVLNGETPVTARTALRIGKYFGNGKNVKDAAASWLRMQADFDVWHAHEELKGELGGIEPLPKEAVEGLD